MYQSSTHHIILFRSKLPWFSFLVICFFFICEISDLNFCLFPKPTPTKYDQQQMKKWSATKAPSSKKDRNHYQIFLPLLTNSTSHEFKTIIPKKPKDNLERHNDSSFFSNFPSIFSKKQPKKHHYPARKTHYPSDSFRDLFSLLMLHYCLLVSITYINTLGCAIYDSSWNDQIKWRNNL